MEDIPVLYSGVTVLAEIIFFVEAHMILCFGVGGGVVKKIVVTVVAIHQSSVHTERSTLLLLMAP